MYNQAPFSTGWFAGDEKDRLPAGEANGFDRFSTTPGVATPAHQREGHINQRPGTLQCANLEDVDCSPRSS